MHGDDRKFNDTGGAITPLDLMATSSPADMPLQMYSFCSSPRTLNWTLGHTERWGVKREAENPCPEFPLSLSLLPSLSSLSLLPALLHVAHVKGDGYSKQSHFAASETAKVDVMRVNLMALHKRSAYNRGKTG